MNPTSDPKHPPRLLYVCVEEVIEGSAASTHVRELAAALARQGAAVEVVAPPVPGPLRLRLPARLWRIIVTMRRAAAGLAECDVVYMRAHPLLWPLARLAKARGLPVVQEVNGRDVDIFLSHGWARSISPALMALQRAQYRDANAIVAVTRGLCDWLRALPGVTGRIGCITNGANIDIFAPGGPRPKAVPETAYAVFFGGFHPWHGIQTMLAATRHPAWPEQVKLVFVGDGPEASLVDAAASEPGSGGRVMRLERCNHQTLPAIISHAIASLVIIENKGGKAETGLAPLKFFESLASGVPVIVSDQPDMADLVRKAGCGVVIPEGDPEALAEAVAALYFDPLLLAELGRNARAEAVARNSWDIKAAELLEFVTPVLGACCSDVGR